MDKHTKTRVIRRTVGHIAARLGSLPLGIVSDPRKGSISLKMRTALTAVLTGMVAGCKGLGKVEERTTWLTLATLEAIAGLRRRTVIAD